jgi:hypothetical protein
MLLLPLELSTLQLLLLQRVRTQLHNLVPLLLLLLLLLLLSTVRPQRALLHFF